MNPISGLFNIIRKLIPNANDRALKRLLPILTAINEHESVVQSLSDEDLKSQIPLFKQRIANGESLDDLLVEVFAVVREASRRTLGMRHFDVQLMGGMVLHQGKIAEMKTGEGKTLVATLPVVLNALSGKGVHVVTVNDYLARRDAEWMGRIYTFLGLSVGVIMSGTPLTEHSKAYRQDITYGTNNEFGFDYLRDNMQLRLTDFAQRGHTFAIVDEVDSILIDEARTPLIISGPSEEATDLYLRVDRIIPRFTRDIDYSIDEKSRTVSMTENGVAKAERALGVDNLYDPENMVLLHHTNQALRAHTLFKRDVDYVVKDGEILIVDEFTGRLMQGRRWSDGLHQAVEAKEGVKIASENQTLATITFQNYFRMYEKLAGMTGTAITEAAEFSHIYKLDVVSIPTNCPLVRVEYPDVVMKSEREKFQKVVEEIEECNKLGRPVLVGTIAIEKSEKLSKMLARKNIRHNVLNAKHHSREAEIIAQAGRKGAVTIATNMAGRGTDILLGGNPEFLTRLELQNMNIGPDDPDYAEIFLKTYAQVKTQTEQEHEAVVALSGLHIIGTERHESRRIDNQLRGRAGRQGDPGSSRFYLSLEDDLMRIFAPEKMKNIMERFGMEEGIQIQHPFVTKAIENAQKKVEAHHFSARKHILEYDDVMNKQREVIYRQRMTVLNSDNIEATILEMIEEVIESILELHILPKTHSEQWDTKAIWTALAAQFGEVLSLDFSQDKIWDEESLLEHLVDYYQNRFREKMALLTPMKQQEIQRGALLYHIDVNWKEHLLNMDHLKEGIGLRGFGQRDPLTEYKREGFDLFQEMIHQIKVSTVNTLFIAQFSEESVTIRQRVPVKIQEGRGMIPSRIQRENAAENSQEKTNPLRRIVDKIGRNDDCPCGSGKKYKKCCMNKTEE